jgi:putative lipase involved disintegration of autophagic bodies
MFHKGQEKGNNLWETNCSGVLTTIVTQAWNKKACIFFLYFFFVFFNYFVSIDKTYMLILIVCLFACLTFVLGSTQQRPFSTVQQTNKLELKTIYHRTHGPIPGLFRKHKVSSQDYVGVDVRHVLGSFDRPDSADRDALSSLLDKGKQIRWSLLDNVRPMNLESSINHPLPNLSDRATILSLAMISNNAYVDAYINSTEWYDLGEPWSVVS